MDDAKPIASLSPRLLARKGAAKPAMRPQYHGQEFPGPDRANAESATEISQELRDRRHEDLGWNDMGDEPDSLGEAAPAPDAGSRGADARVLHLIPSALVRQRDALAAAMGGPAPVPATVVRRSALDDGRRAAFTLRVDAERHLRLRMACAVKNRSAQQLVTEALDRVLAEVNGLDDLARRARHTRQH